jgi:uncharacterized protein (DUF1697 family)
VAKRYVALLRGINVGKAKRVAMADLRSLVEGLGCRDVRTLLNSGNVVFTATRGDKLARRIEKALKEKLGITARVVVLTSDELEAVVSGNTLGEQADNPSRLMVAFFVDPGSSPKLGPLTEQDWSPEAFALSRRAAYLWCPQGILESPLVKEAGKGLGDGVTMRNWATVLKLQALLLAE